MNPDSSTVDDDGPDMLAMAVAKLAPFKADRKPGRYGRVAEPRVNVSEIL